MRRSQERALRKFRKTPNSANRIEYIERNQKYKEVLKEEEKKYFENKATMLMQCKDSKMLWKEIRELKPRGRKTGIRVEPEDLVKRYENEMWDAERANNNNKTRDIHIEVLDKGITAKEFEEALTELKDGKAPGSDGIPAEYIKYASMEFGNQVKELIRDIWISESVPESFKNTIIFPIFKKGDPMQVENYRGVAFANSLNKLLTRQK